jgi:hypothetical protein
MIFIVSIGTFLFQLMLILQVSLLDICYRYIQISYQVIGEVYAKHSIESGLV